MLHIIIQQLFYKLIIVLTFVPLKELSREEPIVLKLPLIMASPGFDSPSSNPIDMINHMITIALIFEMFYHKCFYAYHSSHDAVVSYETWIGHHDIES